MAHKFNRIFEETQDEVLMTKIAKPLLIVLVLLTALTFLDNALAVDISQKSTESVPTVVLSDFATHDNLYRSSQEAVKFSELLSISLMEDSAFEWVERTAISRALEELKLSASGLLDSADRLQIGRWLKADLLIKGDFYRRTSGTWRLDIEVIDLDHADVVAQRSIAFRHSRAEHLTFGMDTVKSTCITLLSAMAEARRELRQTRQQLKVAPLFFQNDDPGGRLDYFEEDLMKAFTKSKSLNGNIRFIEFPRASQSIHEAELIVSGLVDTDPDLWEHLADFYVWGSYREVNSSGVSFEKVTVKATITLWDGSSAPETLTELSTVADLPELSHKIVRRVRMWAQSRRPRKPSTEVRTQVAEDLLARAADIQDLVVQRESGNWPNISDTWWRQREHAIQMLSVASFLAPDNEDIRTALLVESTRDDIDGAKRSNRFWRLWARAKAWEDHCEKFGFNYRHSHLSRQFSTTGLADNRLFRGNSAHMYVYPLMKLIEECKGREIGHGNKAPLPRDIPSEVVREWRIDFSAQYAEHLHRVATECPEMIKGFSGEYLLCLLEYSQNKQLQAQIIEALWSDAVTNPRLWHAKKRATEKISEIYESIGNPGRGEQLLSMLPQEDPREIIRTKGATYVTTKRHLLEKYGHLPKEDASRKDRNEDGSKGSARSGAARANAPVIDEHTIPSIKARMHSVSFKRHFFVHNVTAMANVNNCLWVAVRGQEVFGNLDQASAIILYDHQKKTIMNISRRLGLSSKVTSMTLDNGILWTTFSSDGVWAIDTRTLKSKKYTVRDGITSNEMYCSSSRSDRLFFGGGIGQSPRLCHFNKETLKWSSLDVPKNLGTFYRLAKSVSDEDWFAVHSNYYGSGTNVLLLDIKKMRWSEVGRKLIQQYPALGSSSGELWVIGLGLEEGGLWIVTEKGLAFLDLRTMKYNSVWASAKKITAFLNEDEFLWIARTGTPFNRSISGSSDSQDCRLLCYHKPTGRWCAEIAVPYGGCAEQIVRIDNTLWLGMNSESALVSVDLSGFSFAGN